MCPVCAASMALMVAGAASSGGLTLFTVNKLWKKKGTPQQKEGKNETSRGRIGSGNRLRN